MGGGVSIGWKTACTNSHLPGTRVTCVGGCLFGVVETEFVSALPDVAPVIVIHELSHIK